MHTIEQISVMCKGLFLQKKTTATIEHLVIDSRRIHFTHTSLFFALPNTHRDGHTYLQDAYDKGIRNFIVSKKIAVTPYADATIIYVKNTLQALQLIATAHRQQCNLPIIGITGSNGKTIVKEWLNQLLQNDYTIIRSPKSYNSQIGVPLSVWAINATHQLGIFEAGISTRAEMKNLERIIKPTIGILTNIGTAHNQGFSSEVEKLKEKLQLFTASDLLIYCSDNHLIQKEVTHFAKDKNITLLAWGSTNKNEVVVTKKIGNKHTALALRYKSRTYKLLLNYTDAASIENAMHCITYLLYKQYSEKQINLKLKQLQPVALRLEQKKGQHNCILINDTYSNDWDSLVIALDYLSQQSTLYSKTVLLTDMEQSSVAAKQLYKKVADLLIQKKIQKFIGIGTTITTHQQYFKSIPTTYFFEKIEAAALYCKPSQFNKEAILCKGARSFALETIVQQLEEKVHQTVLEISSEKLIQNIKIHQQLLQPATQIMAIVKAFGYGSGSVEVAQVLQQIGVHYLAVAYADEGVALRKAGIHLPIMVMNVDVNAFDSVLDYNLEPELYSLSILTSFLQYAQKNALSNYPIHIKLDTGMHRLGFEEKELNQLCHLLQHQNVVQVQTIFSHLVGSESKALDSFTKKQNNLFIQLAATIEKALGYTIIKHIANSGAIERHPSLQHQMVRLGIGMYGVTYNSIGLQQVCTLKTTIAQLKLVQQGDTVGYGRKGKVLRQSKIATIRIGYADGYSRQLGNGVGKVLVGTQLVPTVGNVCMDMTMIDVTDVPNVQEGDYVTLFGEALPVYQLADWCHTIPYEILTGISERVKRVYVED